MIGENKVLKCTPAHAHGLEHGQERESGGEMDSEGSICLFCRRTETLDTHWVKQCPLAHRC